MAKYIPGIFNYCDSWCERCPFTARCRNFAMQRAMERKQARLDKENEAFWDAMDKACGGALAELTRQADALGNPETREEEDEAEREAKGAFSREIDEEEKAVRAHPLSRLADEYFWPARRWLERRRDPARVPPEIADAVDVVAWYHIFIGVKLARALHGLLEAEDDDYEELVDDDGVPFPKDSDGSAKIAIIAIERSFAAWSILRDRSEKERKHAVKMMAALLKLRAEADRYFPEARKFHRPGFDGVGSRD